MKEFNKKLEEVEVQQFKFVELSGQRDSKYDPFGYLMQSIIGFEENPNYKEGESEPKLISTLINENYNSEDVNAQSNQDKHKSHSYDPEKHEKLIMKKPTYETYKNLNRVNAVCNIQRKILSDIHKLQYTS